MTTDEPTPGTDAPPVCPRHPDRVSYVRCQRCQRPTCPECQRQAAVGVQCVECVAAAARSQRAATTVLGGRVEQGRPVATITIVGLCVLNYVLQQISPEWTYRWAFAPVVGDEEPFRFLSGAFLHAPGQVLHIVMNMVALWMVGPYLERMLGRARFVALYVLSALGGSVAVLLLASPSDPSWTTAVVGASGAVFGLFGAVLVVLRRLRQNTQSFLGVLVVNVVIGFVVPGIAWQAHLGGLVVGLGLGAAFAYAPRERRRAVAVQAVVAVGVLLVVLSAMRYGLV